MEKKEIPKKINLGIEILRFLMSLWIVVIHCSFIKSSHRQYLGRQFHVPTFIVISFFFYYRVFTGKAINKIISRFQRLLIPYIIWPILVLLINNIFLSAHPFGYMLKNITIKDIIIQLLIGSKIHAIFWFQFNLIFLSLLFTLIFLIVKKNVLKVLILLGIISFFLHVSKISYNFFVNYKQFFGRNIGTLIELLPMALMGCILSYIYQIFRPSFLSLYPHFIMSFTIYILFQFNIFIRQPGFLYPNVSLNILASTNLFLLFFSFPFENSKYKKYSSIILNITKFTGGIYYIHPIFRDYLQKYSYLL